MDIRKLFLNDNSSDEYKDGWNDAVCWLNENYKITDKEKKEICIAFDINLSEARILEIIQKEKENAKSRKL